MMKNDSNRYLLKVARESYPDDLVPETYADAVRFLHSGPASKGHPGDTLALFIAIECCEVAEGHEGAGVFIEASLAMERAARELHRVAMALSRASGTIEEGQ